MADRTVRSVAEITAALMASLARQLKVKSVDPKADLAELGLDSVGSAAVASEISTLLGRNLSPTLLIEHPTIESLGQALAGTGEGGGGFGANDVVVGALERSATGGLAYLSASDEKLDGVHLRIAGRTFESYCSCSYTGIEFDPRLREGALSAIDRFGTQFSYSRAYVSSPAYRELEELLERIFEHPVELAQTTTLAHQAVLPVVVDRRDAVILDQQVHHSVSVAAALLRAEGIPVTMIAHNDMDQLEARVRELTAKHRRVFYLADGIYSMYGDAAPFADLASLMDRYPALFVYVDDAHGMGWRGKHGRGYALDVLPMREQLILATSLDKAFAALGGVVLVPDPAARRKVRLTGGPLVFSGPLNPPMLGIAIASAKLHLSAEIIPRQKRVDELLSCADRVIRERDLPVVGPFDTPIRFVAIGSTSTTERVLRRMAEEGYLVNGSMFPAVPMNRAGVRFTITAHAEPRRLEAMLHVLADIVEEELARAETSSEGVRDLFGRRLFR